LSRTTAVPPGQTTWDIDITHSSLGFSVRHLVISKVHGRFDRWSGSLMLDETHPERSRVEARIEAASIDTHEPKRDAHLRSPDFFDTDKHPDITFRSTQIAKTDNDRYQMVGDLAIVGVTRPVVLLVEVIGRVKDPWGAERAGFSARTTIDRREFGLVWNQALEAGGVVIGETVEIAIEIEAVQRSETPAGQTA
jgi:polyisoprenoid-binding protein YceI